MSPADLRRVLKFKRALLQHVEQCMDLLLQDVARIAQKQCVGCVDDVRRSQPVMYEPRGGSD